MFEHHQRTIEKLVDRFRADDNFLALMVVGSVARGTARENSDVDIVLVATAEEFQLRKSQNRLHYSTADVCDYEGGYVEGKIVDLAILQAAAERGCEPTRAQFCGARIAFSRIAGLEAILENLSAYPTREQKEKMKSFLAQVRAQRWRIADAEARNDLDPLVLATAAAKLALFGGRLILAHNKILFPCHKRLKQALTQAPDQPTGMLELMEALLKNPCSKTADAFCSAILDFHPWEEPEEGWSARFCRDVEWPWLENNFPLEEI